MSKQSITDKANVIRNETQQYANTRGRVADILDDINETKADRTEVAEDLSAYNTALQNHIGDHANPHAVTAAQVGLGNVDNTHDADKPLSSAAQAQGAAFQSALSSEISARQSGDALVSAAITQEVSDRKASGSALQSQIGSNATAIAQEVADRKSAVSSEATARQNADALALLKPTTTATDTITTYTNVVLVDANGNSAKYPAGALGKNIANSALTSVAGAGLTLAAPWTLNAANYPYYITGTLDKSADTTFNQLLVQNSSGQVAKSTNAALMVNATTAMSDAQKLAMRKAALLSTEAYSTGQAVISSINPPIILQKPGYTQYVSIIGSSLFIDPTSTQAQIKIVDSSGNETLVNNFTTAQSNPNILTFPVTDGQLVTGDFTFKIFNNGVWSAANSQAVLRVRQSITQLAMPNVNWTVQDYTGAVPPDYTGSLASGKFAKSLTATSCHLFSTATALASGVYAQGDFAITPAMMNAGLLIILDINLTNQSWGGMNIGLISSGFINTDTYTFSAFLMPPLLQNSAFKPSGTPIPSSIYTVISGGYSLTDQLFIIISSGQITMVIKSKGQVSTMAIDMSKTFFLKMSVINQSNQTDGTVNINSIYQLS